jgi:UDP-3-O-[3-hydroxymyristoyl] glucosamine N-acyltransferase
LKASAVAAALNARIVGDASADILRAVHPSSAEDSGDIAVAVSPDTARLLPSTRAHMALVVEGTEPEAGRFTTLIVAGRSRTTLPDVTSVFRHHPPAEPGVHPSAIVAPDARIGRDVRIGPFTVIGSGASIGPRSVVLSQATIAEGASIGEDCLIYPGVRIGWDCRIGDRAVIHHNASIGADGFGFLPVQPGAVDAARGSSNAAAVSKRNVLRKIHALSIVEIGDDVEIGALTAIDRGTLKPTRIGSGTKIDDLVMIGHNVEIGTDSMLCGQVALAGSVSVGNGVVLGGKVGVADHLEIGDGAVVGGGSLVGTNVPAGAVYLGVPAVPRQQALDNLKLMHRVKRFLDAAKERKT